MASKISVAQTKRRTAHFATGQPSELPASVLPLEVDIFNKFKLMQGDMANATNKDIAKILADEVTEW